MTVSLLPMRRVVEQTCRVRFRALELRAKSHHECQGESGELEFELGCMLNCQAEYENVSHELT